MNPDLKSGILAIENAVERAKVAAAILHRNQLYGGSPYILHLHNVAFALQRFGHDSKTMVCSGYLHDVLEDCKEEVSYEDLVDLFNTDVAEIVYAVTDAEGATRAERHTKTYIKTGKDDRAVAVKLADRIANVESCILTDNARLGMYRKEHAGFKKALQTKSGHALMWKWLDFLLRK